MFACGEWSSTGRGMVRVLHICSTEIKTVKISSEESRHISRKFHTNKEVPAIWYLHYSVKLKLTVEMVDEFSVFLFVLDEMY